MPTLKEYHVDYKTLTSAIDKLVDCKHWLEANRDGCLPASQPAIAAAAGGIIELINALDARQVKVGSDYIKMLQLEEDQKKVDDLLKGLKNG